MKESERKKKVVCVCVRARFTDACERVRGILQCLHTRTHGYRHAPFAPSRFIIWTCLKARAFRQRCKDRGVKTDVCSIITSLMSMTLFSMLRIFSSIANDMPPPACVRVRTSRLSVGTNDHVCIRNFAADGRASQ